MKFFRLAAVLLALAVYATATPGASPKIDESALAGMRKGQTTFDEVVRRFGRPNFSSTSWDGTRTAAYAYGEGWSPSALSALGAALGGSNANTVVLHFDGRGVLTDYKTNQAAVKPGDPPSAPAVRYVEPSFGGAAPTPAAAKPAAVPAARYVEPSFGGAAQPSAGAKPAAAPAAAPLQATAIPPEPAAKPPVAKASKPEAKNDGLPSWLPSSSTRGDRY